MTLAGTNGSGGATGDTCLIILKPALQAEHSPIVIYQADRNTWYLRAWHVMRNPLTIVQSGLKNDNGAAIFLVTSDEG